MTLLSPHLSIVIPCYNEEKRLPISIPLILDFIRKQPFAIELIFSDDGSKDLSVETIRKHMGNHPYYLLLAPRNEGKGSAVKRGMLAASGDYVLFSDTDLSTPLSEVLKFIPYLQDGYEGVIGSRALDRSKIEIRQNILRETMGKVFNFIARRLSFKNIKDSQCGFKCFTRHATQDLFQRQKISGFAFDVEILYLAQKLGYRIKEEPVRWKNETQSQVRLFSDPIKMFWDVLQIRRLHPDKLNP